MFTNKTNVKQYKTAQKQRPDALCWHTVSQPRFHVNFILVALNAKATELVTKYEWLAVGDSKVEMKVWGNREEEGNS